MKFTCLILILIVINFSHSKSVKPKIIGGRDAERNEFPYIVSLRRTEIESIQGISHICGGSIINETTILTAAHCLYDVFGNLLTQPLSFLVAGGFLGLYTDYPYEYRLATKIIIHPNFDPEELINDIAIIQVEPKFDFSLSNFKPIEVDYNQTYREGAEW
jgi:secreted trypsin-like serine protease